MGDLDRYAALVGLNYKNEISNKELEELHLLYKQIQEAIEKAKMLDEIGIDIFNLKHWEFTYNNVDFAVRTAKERGQEIQNLKSQLEGNYQHLPECVRIMKNDASEDCNCKKIIQSMKQQLEQANKVIDEIRELTNEPDLADYGSQSFYYINVSKLESILAKYD